MHMSRPPHSAFVTCITKKKTTLFVLQATKAGCGGLGTRQSYTCIMWKHIFKANNIFPEKFVMGKLNPNPNQQWRYHFHFGRWRLPWKWKRVRMITIWLRYNS